MATKNTETTQLNNIDTAVTKLMVDGKARSVIEIAKELNKGESNLDYQMVKNRVMTLVQRPDMYDRRNAKAGSKDVQYTMKRAYALSVKNAIDSNVKMESTVKEPIAKSTARTPVVIKNALQEALEKVDLKPVIRATDIDLKVTKEDSVNLAIWKVTHDGEFYTAADIGLMVEHIDIKASTIAARMSTLVEKGWFDTDASSSPKRYSLRKHVEAPVGEAPYNRRVTTKDRKVVTAADVDAGALCMADDQPKETKDMLTGAIGGVTITDVGHAEAKKIAGSVPPLYNETPPRIPLSAFTAAQSGDKNQEHVTKTASETIVEPLISVAVTIAGMDLTSEETSELAHELQERGLLLPEDEHFDSIVKTHVMYSIKGKMFTRAQAATILHRLVELGF